MFIYRAGWYLKNLEVWAKVLNRLISMALFHEASVGLDKALLSTKVNILFSLLGESKQQ